MDTQHRQTLYDLLALGDSSHPALVLPEGGPVVTYNSLRDQVESLAATLQTLGLGRGDRVALA
jgi:acyl-coenzyme A synthetase/AMP-(fatty) acid ligase